jgi:hypothetical protein
MVQVRPMKAKLIASSLLLTAIACHAELPHPHDENSAYSVMPSVSYDHSSWMGQVPSGASLLDMSIPGAHDSWYPKKTTFDFGKVMDTGTMLKAGIRAFDASIGCVVKKETTGTASCNFVYADMHSSSDDAVSKVDVQFTLTELRNFLITHPTETILLHLSKSDSSLPVPVGWTLATDDQWDLAVLSLLTYGTQPVINSVFDNKGASEADLRLLKLADVRGRIVFLKDWKAPSHAALSRLGMSLQENFGEHSFLPYKLSTNWDLYDFWKKLQVQLSAVNEAHIRDGSGVGAISYVTGYGGGYPYFVSSGYSSIEGSPLWTGKTITGSKSTVMGKNPWPDYPIDACTKPVLGLPITCSVYFSGLNFMLNDALSGGNSAAGNNHTPMRQYRNLGVLMLDFPGEKLLKTIINSNRGISATL